MKLLISTCVIGLIGGLLILISLPSDSEVILDSSPAAKLLDECFKTDKKIKLKALKDLLSMEFDGETKAQRADEASTWYLEQTTQQRIDAYAPYTDALGEALMNETVGTFIGVE